MSESQLILADAFTSLPNKLGKRLPHYDWDLASSPPILGAHSLAKHDVLKEYLQKYVSILASRPVQEKLKLTLVGGFAGGGVYLHPETNERLPGSPIIMAEAMQAAEVAMNKDRRKDFHLDVEYMFIEKRKQTIEHLNRELTENESAAKQRDRIQVLPGCFSEHLDGIIERVMQRSRFPRVIFVLDQYGFTDVRMQDLRKIFRKLPNAEVILTIAIDWLIDHWTEKTNYDQILVNLGINLSSDYATQMKQAHPQDWRPVIQNTLHAEFRSNSGAGYYTPFFIHSVESHRAYWLLHFSGHSKARDVMMQLHWEMENHFQHFGSPGIGMLGYDPKRKADLLQPTFSYDFDASARQLTGEALMDQVPRLIDRCGIQFSSFFEQTVNQTPATKAMIAEQIQKLTLEHELEVLTATGKLRRNGVQIQNDDIIRRVSQTSFLPSQLLTTK